MTPKLQELIQMLSEECSEVIKDSMKTLRHGVNSYNPHDDFQKTNVMLLRDEIIDVLCIVKQLTDIGFIEDIKEEELLEAWQKKLKWTHFQ